MSYEPSLWWLMWWHLFAGGGICWSDMIGTSKVRVYWGSSSYGLWCVPMKCQGAKSIGQWSERSRSSCIFHFDNNSWKWQINTKDRIAITWQGPEIKGMVYNSSSFLWKGFWMQCRFHGSYGPNMVCRYLNELDPFCSLVRIYNWDAIATIIC